MRQSPRLVHHEEPPQPLDFEKNLYPIEDEDEEDDENNACE